jgi:hypothetical protein
MIDFADGDAAGSSWARDLGSAGGNERVSGQTGSAGDLKRVRLAIAAGCLRG